MKELCFAEFARCLKAAIQPPNDDKSIVELLLSWITDKDSVLDKKGDPICIVPSLISDLLNRKVDVPKAIKKACMTAKAIEEAIDYCQTRIIPCLNPVLRADMFEAMWKMVSADESMATKNKEKLASLLESEEEGKFLGWLLIYVINRENRICNTPVASDDIPLLAEANYECPLCHTQLVEYIKKKPVKKYEVVELYPSDISNRDTEFDSISKPDHLDSPENKLVLCLKHAQEYGIDPTVKEYMNLKEIKERLSSAYFLRIDINDSVLEEEIQSILVGLGKITDETKLIELPLKALRLDQKILPQNHLLKNDVMTRVIRYYNFIDDLFSAMDRDGTGDFDLIASEVKVAYGRLDDGKLSQEEIVDRLADWIRIKSGVGIQNLRACHIVVAYFIQNCEVFREISK